ncbi:unnamed protein product, partial [Pocillopora meandrina]
MRRSLWRPKWKKEREIVRLEINKQAEENKIDNLERGDNMDIVSMELESSTTQRTKPYIYKVETLNSAQTCMPTINATPNSVLPLTKYAPAVQVFKHEIGPHSKGEAESLRHQPGSNSRSQKVPVQFQSSPLVETCKQFPVQFQSSCPLEHHMRATLKPPHSDRFPKQGSVQTPLSRLVEHLPQSNIAPRQGSREEIAQALCQVVLSPKVEYMCFDGN